MSLLISICIPAYKRTDYLKRLLDSLVIQTFQQFEVVVTDDSNDASVSALLQQYEGRLNIVYRKNAVALGTPANWNAAIQLAKGEWIKLMHDDDWLAHEHSLQQFADATRHNQQFVFCAYTSRHLQNGTEKAFAPDAAELALLRRQPHVLQAKNIIGPPSVTMVHRAVTALYDERMKWMVDFDFYIRVLQQTGFYYIPEKLVCIGMSDEQVTATAFRNPAVEIPEAWLMLEKYGAAPLHHIRVYDAWWRMMRNLGIRKKEQLQQYTPGKNWPLYIQQLLQHQRMVPLSLLKIGPVSKILMACSYLLNKVQ